MADFKVNEIADLCRDFAPLDETAINRLSRYGELLLEWNEKMNLTAITEPQEVAYKHFYDCLLLLKNVSIAKDASVIDVGTGAGFPGIVIKIARPDIKLTLLDGLNKRLVFLNEVLTELGLSAETVHARAEELAKKPEYRERFDIATARAVAQLGTLSEYCLPFVKKGGTFVAMKGPGAGAEIAAAEKALKLLGGGTPQIIGENLPDGIARTFVVVKKISQTPTKYPRISAKIAKQPL